MGIPEFKLALEDTVLNVFIILMAGMRSHAYMYVCEKSFIILYLSISCLFNVKLTPLKFFKDV